MSSGGVEKRRRKRPLSRYDDSAQGAADVSGRDSDGGVKHKQQSLKNQKRSIQRLLAKKDIPSHVRQVQEVQLRKVEMLIEKRRENERERKLALRYHKVRFFERVKLTRKIKRAKKRLSQADVPSDERVELENELTKLEGDLAYVMHFPKGEKYVSILANDLSPQARERVVRLREIAMKTQSEQRELKRPQQDSSADVDADDEELDEFFI